MANNIMNEYIKLTSEHMKQYMELIFKDKFEKHIYNSFWEAYLNARYYDLNGSKTDNTLKNEILTELKSKKIKLLQKEKDTLHPTIENMYTFFTHILYFDRVIASKDLSKTVDVIHKLRKDLLGKDEKKFQELLLETVEMNGRQINEMLKKYETKDFYVKILNYRTKNVYKVSLKYNFRISMIYSNLAIERAFNTGVVNEDKLIIEYNLMTIQVIRRYYKRKL